MYCENLEVVSVLEMVWLVMFGRCDVIGVVSDAWSMLVSGLTVSDFEQECLAALARVPRSLQQGLH